MPTPARDPDPISPLLEFDPSPLAVIEPSATVRSFPVPETLVICYFRDAIEKLCAEAGAEEVGQLVSEMGRIPVHAVDWAGTRVGIVQGGVGAPLAVGWLEELIAIGVRRVVVVGGAGALVPGLTLGHVVVPTSAVRDEGTSHHYLPASRTVEPTLSAVAAITRTLERRGVPYVSGATWTTDALFRETRAKMARRVAEGCLTVEMEAAALFAVAQFRGIALGQMLYAGDDLSGESWDHRDWQGHASGRDLLLRLACDAAVAMGEGAADQA
jgi:uridine phosphorylase